MSYCTSKLLTIKIWKNNIVNANKNSSDEDIKRHKDVTINFLKETVDEMPRTQRDFSRMKFMYTKVKRELNEKTDDLNKEIMFLRANKDKTMVNWLTMLVPNVINKHIRFKKTPEH